MGNVYSWKVVSGSWLVAANWIDVTSGSDPAASAPASGETAQFNQTGPAATITGPGAAELATFNGNWVLAGQFEFGVLAVDGGTGTGFQVAPGASIAAGGAVLNGRVGIAGAGAVLAVDMLDFASLGTAPVLAVHDNAVMRAGTAGLGDAQILVDATALLEIGALGDAAVGKLTVDDGLRVVGHGFSLTASIVNGGTIATDGAASIVGDISGVGVLEIGAGGALRLAGNAGAGQGIRLAGAGATLDLSPGGVAAGPITGFLAGTTIIMPGGIDGVGYVATPAGGVLDGRLELSAGGTLLATLDLHGDFAGRGFLLVPAGGVVAVTNDAPAARQLQWNAVDGLWSTVTNWTDVTGSAQPAQSAPGGNDTVEVTGTAAEIAITGPGTVAVLSVAGNVMLDGSYIAGSVAFLPYNSATDSVARLAGGTTLASNRVTVTSNLEVSGSGTSLDVTGTLALGTDGPPGSPTGPVTIGQITLADHAVARVDALDLSGYFGLSTILIGGLTIDVTSVLEVGRAGGAAAGALTVDAGHTVTIGADIQADVVNNGSLVTEGFSYLVPRVAGTVSGIGLIHLTSALFEFGGGVDFAGAVGAGQTIGFGGPNQLLKLEAPGSFAATITGFTSANTIALPAVITSASFAPSGAGGVLSLFAGGTPAGSLAFAGAEFETAGFSIDMVGGEAILSTDVPCFAAGTRIATSRGLVAVEALRRGDKVLNPWGELLAVRWLGYRRVDCRRHPRPHDVLPVRVSADAFGPDMPERDLHLSPDHAVFSDGMLVPVRYLLNGATVVQRDAAEVIYWHVELERHDVLLAEGLPCESYLDTGNRAAFTNGGPTVTLHAAFGDAWDSMACGRLVTKGAGLAVLRARLFEQALALGHRVTVEAGLHLASPGGRTMPRRAGAWHVFRLPTEPGMATLRSRSTVPAELWPGHDDHRRLGVAVPRLRLDGEVLPLDHPRLGTGWHAPEPGLRWTDGAAEIDLSGARRLAIEAPTLLEYWDGAPVSPAGRSGFRCSRL